ncbi:MAG: YifB family Mg chelatase-like AAA ATPase [Butyrivibrio sp.]|nr:YifB family Mg chelatase-like AAA ATPase [Butyrivibrio sp.]
MVGKVISAAVSGVTARLVEVEADIASGIPSFELTGNLGGTAKEARERVRTALRNSEIRLKPGKITVNLAPANIRKEGPHFDLAIAAALLCACNLVPREAVGGVLFAGELRLDGGVNEVNAVLPMIISAAEAGLRRCIVPRGNLNEGGFAEGIEVVGVGSLSECAAYLKGERRLPSADGLCLGMGQKKVGGEATDKDFGDIRGQRALKRAVTVAAAGMHNLLMIGPPGSGKTMTAERLPTILPPPSYEQRMEIWRIYSVAGMLDGESLRAGKRPFRSPRHTVTAQTMAGGGRNPMPGEMSLAQHGILFLDELNLFDRRAVETLREPLESGRVRINRVGGAVEYPADFMLVAAINPCLCGYYPDRRKCRCTPMDIKRHFGHISKPIMDRIDICVQAPPVAYEDIGGGGDAYDSAYMKKEVERAFEAQKKRFKDCGFESNSAIPAARTAEHCRMEADAEALLKKAYETCGMSARSYYKILRVARTVADIEGSELIRAEHISEAVGYKSVGE